MISRTRFSFTLFSWLLLSSVTFDLRAVSQVQDEKPLPLGTSAPEPISPKQKRVYTIELQTGQYLGLDVEQRGIDVSLSFTGPDGNWIYTINSTAGPHHIESGSIVASVSGVYRIEIQGSNQAAEAGEYILTVAGPRTATELDRHHAAADHAMAEGDRRRTVERNLPEAVKQYASSIQEARAAQYLYREADAGVTMGFSYFQMGESLGALKSYAEALVPIRAAGAKNLEFDAINNTGIVYRTLGEWQDALTNYLKAHEISREIRDQVREAIILINLGTTYRMMGDSKAALSYFRQAHQAAVERKDLPRQINGLFSIGVIYTDQGVLDPAYYQTALEYFDQAIAICHQIKDEARLALIGVNKAGAYREMSQFPEALALLDEARQIFSRLERTRELASVHHEIGRVHERLDRQDLALENYKSALEIARKATDLPLQTRALTGLARVERNRGNPAGAQEKIAEAIKTIESLRTRIGSPDLRASYLSLHRSSYDFYVDLLLRLDRLEPGARHNEAALRASESARGRVLLDNLLEARTELSKKGGSSGLQCRNFAELVEREQALQKRLEVDSVQKNVDDLIREYRTVGSQIKACNPNYYALIYQKPLDLARLQQRALDPETTLLEFALGEERSYLFLLTDKSLQTFELPKRAEIEKAASEYYENLRARSIPGDTAAQRAQRIKKADTLLPQSAAKLSQMLLGEAAPKLTGKRLLIVGDGELYRLPFAALPLPKSTPSPATRMSSLSVPLISKYEITQLPSATLLEFLLDKPARLTDERQTIAVIADPVFSSGDPRLGARRTQVAAQSSTQSRQARKDGTFGIGKYDRLPGTRTEATTIAGLVPQNQRLIALDFDANQDLVMSRRLSKYRYLHFATHSVFHRHPELNGLALSMFDATGRQRDGYLQLSEILRLELDADLVVLSACETGVGKPIRGEGLIGLTRGFLAAGAERVMASLWKVDDEETSQLMGIFYRELLQNKGVSPAAALRSAQLEMLKRQPHLPPFYWASFVIQGNPR